MEKPYTAWMEAYTSAKTKAKKLELYHRTFNGEFGVQVKHSLFGIGDEDRFMMDRDTLRNMKFYARLEK